DTEAERDGYLAAREGPLIFPHVSPVNRKVDNVIDDIDCGRRRGKSDECQTNRNEHVGLHYIMSQSSRNKDQQVLQPLMDTQHPGVGSDGRLFGMENLAVRSFPELRRRMIRRD